MKVISWNETSALWYDKSEEEVIGKLFFELFPPALKVTGFADGYNLRWPAGNIFWQ